MAGRLMVPTPAIETRACGDWCRLAAVMTTLLILSLAGLSAFLGARLYSATAENSALRQNIAFLKRRVGRL